METGQTGAHLQGLTVLLHAGRELCVLAPHAVQLRPKLRRCRLLPAAHALVAQDCAQAVGVVAIAMAEGVERAAGMDKPRGAPGQATAAQSSCPR